MNTTTGLFDLDFRNYDPVLGRINGVDPVASKYSSLSPYNYAFNDPVHWNDPGGADPHVPGDWDYAGSLLDAYNNGWSPGMSSVTVMDPGGSSYVWNPATAGGFGVAGYTGPLSPIISSYNPGFGLPAYLTRGVIDNDAQAVRTGNMNVDEYARKYGKSYAFKTYHEVVDHGNVKDRYEWIIGIRLVALAGDGGSCPPGTPCDGPYKSNLPGNNVDLAGGWTDWTGLALDVGDDVMGQVGNNFRALQAESNALRLGLNFGKELGKVNTATTTMKWGGRALGAYNAFNIEMQYRNGQISNSSRVLEQGTNVFSTFGGLYGASWGLGWEIGRSITTIPSYQNWKQDTWLPWRKEKLGY